jgi:hypothetical protein
VNFLLAMIRPALPVQPWRVSIRARRLGKRGGQCHARRHYAEVRPNRPVDKLALREPVLRRNGRELAGVWLVKLDCQWPFFHGGNIG